MAGDNQYVTITPNAAFPYVEVDIDPDFLDTVANAYLSVLVYIPTSIKPDLAIYGGSATLIQSDDWAIGLFETGGDYRWVSDSLTDLGDIVFDAFNQVEWHAIAGASTYDVRVNGVLTTSVGSPFLPATGVNYFSVNGFPVGIVGGAGGTLADDTIGVDELAWSTSTWVSLGGTVVGRWAFDGADPLGDATANYPDPPWFVWEPTFQTVLTGGGNLADFFGEEEEVEPPPDPVGCCAAADELSARVFIDGTEVTDVSVAGGWTPRLNRPAQATVTIPMDAAIGDCGSLLRIECGDCIVFHGPILNLELDTGKDDGRVVYNAQDHMELWQYRIVRDDTADFSKPQIITDYLTGPAIMAAALRNTEGSSTGQGNGALTPPGTAEGPTFLQFGGAASGGASLTGAPVDWPMSLAELFSLLISTGQLDGIISYINPGGGITGRIDLYNGDYGTDRSGDVIFQYGMGSYNAGAVRWNRDMTQVVNKYQLFGGPQVQTAADPAGEQHWCFNVTGDDPNLPSPPGGDVAAPYLGGGGNAPGAAGNELGGRRLDSQAAYGVRMRVDIVDGYDENCIPGFGAPGRMLFRRQWQIFSWLAAMPREIIHITPVPGVEIGCFGIGDLIGVQAVGDVRGGFSGKQRVYGYTVSWDATPSVLTLSEIETSADAEGSGG